MHSNVSSRGSVSNTTTAEDDSVFRVRSPSLAAFLGAQGFTPDLVPDSLTRRGARRAVFVFERSERLADAVQAYRDSVIPAYEEFKRDLVRRASGIQRQARRQPAEGR